MMHVPDEIIHNFIMDLKKKDLNPFDRAKMLEMFREKNNLSQREFGKQFDVPHSTVQDWERWNKLDRAEYDKLQEQGLNHTDIYRQVRDNQTNLDKIKDKLKIDVLLEDAITSLRPYVKLKERSKHTKELLHELNDLTNRMRMNYDKYEGE